MMALKQLLCCARASAWLASSGFFRGVALLVVLSLRVFGLQLQGTDLESIFDVVRHISEGITCIFVAISSALEPIPCVLAKLGCYFEIWSAELSSRAAMAEPLKALTGELKDSLFWAYEECRSLAGGIAIDFMANYAEAIDFIKLNSCSTRKPLTSSS